MQDKQIKKEIERLELIARQLSPSPQTRADWNKQVQDYANDFLDAIETTKAYDQPEEAMIPTLEINTESKSLSNLLAYLKKEVDQVGINPASGGHLGYIPGGGIFPTALGDYLAAVTNRYSGLFFANPGAVKIGNDLIRWMCQLAGYPEHALGNLTSGGSIANLIAITTARDHLNIKGRTIPKAVIYLTHQVHHCVQKALRIAGLKEAIIRYVPIDDRFKMQMDHLSTQLKEDKAAGLQPFLIVGSAGTTDTGAIDPLDEMAVLAKRYGAWFHVDAAYGGAFLLVDQLKASFKGIEQSDSLTIDPHKGFFVSYGLGAVLIKNVDALYDSHFYAAGYMQDAQQDWEERSPADLSPELTRHFRALRLWLPLHLYGTGPFEAALAEKVMLCQYFYQKVQEIGFEVGPPPELSVMIFRYIPDEGDANTFNEALVEKIRADGRIFLSSTTLDGTYWIRLAVVCFRTHLQQIELCLTLLSKHVS
jgi:aromatic-L-amino-acid decarboxylase